MEYLNGSTFGGWEVQECETSKDFELLWLTARAENKQACCTWGTTQRISLLYNLVPPITNSVHCKWEFTNSGGHSYNPKDSVPIT